MKPNKNMKNPIALKSILALALGVFLTQSPALAGPAVQGTGYVVVTKVNPGPVGPPYLPDFEELRVEGWTTKILRNEKGVTVNIHAVGLNPHHAYTAWIGQKGQGRATFLMGHIVGGSCESTFSGRLGLSSKSEGPIEDPLGGEFHVIIADHGPIDELNPPLPAAIKTPAGSIWTHVVIFDPNE